MISSKGKAANSTKAQRFTLGEKVTAKLTKCGWEKLPNGKYAACFYFEDEKGGKMTHQEYNDGPDIDGYSEKWFGVKIERITHILAAFIPKDAMDRVEGNTLEEWVTQFIGTEGGMGLLTPDMYTGIELTLKVGRNKNNFASFGNYPNFITSALNPCTWASNATYDIYEYSTETPDKKKPAVEPEEMIGGDTDAFTPGEEEEEVLI